VATAWIPLGNVTLASNYGTITFNSINQSYKDLIVVINAGSGAYGGCFSLNFNNAAAGGVISFQLMSAYGSSPSVAGYSQSGMYQATIAYSGGDNGGVYMGFCQIFDYSATDKNKNTISTFSAAEGSGSHRDQTFSVNTLGATAAVTRVDVVAGGAQFPAGSSFALYGIAG